MTLYSIQEIKNDSAPLNPNTFINLWLLPGTTTKNHYRSIYNVLNFLGDVGGLSEAFKMIFGFTLGLYN